MDAKTSTSVVFKLAEIEVRPTFGLKATFKRPYQGLQIHEAEPQIFGLRGLAHEAKFVAPIRRTVTPQKSDS